MMRRMFAVPLVPFVAALTAAAIATRPVRAQQTAPYPLDPLTASEITRAVEILRAAGKTDSSSEFANISLHEPSKAQFVAYASDATPPDRAAFAVVYKRATRQTFEAVVDLTKGAVVSWAPKPGVQPPLLPTDHSLIEQIVRMPATTSVPHPPR